VQTLAVKYCGYISHASGYGHAARAYIHALHAAGVELSVTDLASRNPDVEDDLIRSLLHRPLQPDFHIFHGIPTEWAKLAFPLRNAIGLTVWETDVMPTQWRNILDHVIDVWLPCEFNARVFRRGLRSSVYTLPHPVFPSTLNGNDRRDARWLTNIAPTDWVVYSIFEWQDRKCPERQLEAYLRAFGDVSDTVLVIKTNPAAARVAQRALDSARAVTGSSARVMVYAEHWHEAEIAALHSRGDCYLSLHRGEGWGYPLFEAARRGIPVIATGYSGPLDYLDGEAHHLVKYKLVPVRQPYRYYNPSMQWADPDIDHAVELLRHVYRQPAQARDKAERAATRLRRSYTLEAVGAAAKQRLTSLLKDIQPERWKELERAERQQRLQPAIPISEQWYDQDYFEHGHKSNWSEGYSWSLFSGLFAETALFLMEVFPDANSILDIGCAKGFLVRALRERGKSCWGFDFSSWATSHAEEAAIPYIVRASVDDFVFTRGYDLLVAFEVFEHLTEQQVDAFLRRAREHAQLALLATIPSVAAHGHRPANAAPDDDLSHITMRPRAWWHERFLGAGWHQDGLHKVVERQCQEHRLPTRMGWSVYLYAP
jgi:glycosyltransferase involved in cell wall biosynthesis/SAM-dependent methyltransferase